MTAPESTPGGDLLASIDSDDDAAMLRAMRHIVAARIADPKCPARELASLTKRLGDITSELRSKDLEDDPFSAALTLPDEAFDPSTI